MLLARSVINSIVAAALLYSIGRPALADERPKVPLFENKPKVGLVLAGGGALGFAHVGVIEVLEEQRVPVHYVAGTSMGAIVGAAFAAGRTVREMKELAGATDWDSLFNEDARRAQTPYRYRSGRNREIYGDRKLAIVDGSALIASGIIEGQKILPLLQRLYYNVPNPADFTKLPVPFRGVTADIETGEAVVFTQGDLARVVRASMSVPGAFSPVDIDGKLLVDGGIANNLPVDQVIDMGADLLIVVELYADLKARKDLSSLFQISGQIVSLLLAQNSAAQRKLMRPQDILIAPDLTGYSSTDFKEAEPLIALGRTAALAAVPVLRKLSLTADEYQRYKSARENIPSASPIVDFVRLENKSSVVDEKILDAIGIEPGKPLDRAAIETNIGNLFDSGLFTTIDYDIVTEGDKTGVIVRAKSKPWLAQYVRIGGAVEDDFDGNTVFNLGVNYRLGNVNSYGAYLDTEAEVGTSPNLFMELYQPLGIDSPYFVAPAVRLTRSEVRVRQGNEEIAEYERRLAAATLNAGRELGNLGEIFAGITRGHGEFNREIGDPALPEFDYDLGSVSGGFVIDTLDTPDFPTSGVGARVAFTENTDALGDDNEFSTLTAGFSAPLTFGRSTLIALGDFGTTFDFRPADRSFSLGGFLDISGFSRGDLIASDFSIGRLIYYYRFSEIRSPLFGLGLYGGASMELASIYIDTPALSDTTGIFAGSIFFGADTPLVPVYVGFGKNDEDENSLYLALGRIGSRRF